jgi:dihydropteridine reductase
MTKLVLVYGGMGALGKAVVAQFVAKDWTVISIDFTANPDAVENVVLTNSDNWLDQNVQQQISKLMSDGKKFDSIVCVAGGWAGGNGASKSLVQSCEAMWKQSVQTSVISVNLACMHLREDGLLVLTGASAALGATPGMMGYGIAKAAVHQLTKSAAANGSGLPANSKVAALLPVTLDTPGNRAGMPNADFSTWTPLNVLAGKLVEWSNDSSKVTKGGLYEVKTVNSDTTFTEAK